MQCLKKYFRSAQNNKKLNKKFFKRTASVAIMRVITFVHNDDEYKNLFLGFAGIFHAIHNPLVSIAIWMW